MSTAVCLLIQGVRSKSSSGLPATGGRRSVKWREHDFRQQPEAAELSVKRLHRAVAPNTNAASAGRNCAGLRLRAVLSHEICTPVSNGILPAICDAGNQPQRFNLPWLGGALKTRVLYARGRPDLRSPIMQVTVAGIAGRKKSSARRRGSVADSRIGRVAVALGKIKSPDKGFKP